MQLLWLHGFSLWYMRVHCLQRLEARKLAPSALTSHVLRVTASAVCPVMKMFLCCTVI